MCVKERDIENENEREDREWSEICCRISERQEAGYCKEEERLQKKGEEEEE